MWALLPTKAAMAAPITRMSSSLSPSATAGRAGDGDGASPGAFVSASVLTIAAVRTGAVAAASLKISRNERAQDLLQLKRNKLQDHFDPLYQKQPVHML